MDRSAFAEDLREARRFRKFTIGDVASMTCVQKEYLEAIEAGRWDEVPQAYLRGYIRLIAHATGMNAEKVMIEFDQVTASGSHVNPPSAWGESAAAMPARAVIDEARPLLPHRMRVGDSRAKIRAGWFQSLTDKRPLAYLLLAVLLAGAWAGRGLIRQKVAAPEILTLPFENALLSAVEATHSPFTQVVLDSATESQGHRKSRGLYFVGLTKGTVLIPVSIDSTIMIRHDVHDTIAIIFGDSVMIQSFPGGSIMCFTDSFDPIPTAGLHQDTALFIYPPVQEFHGSAIDTHKVGASVVD